MITSSHADQVVSDWFQVCDKGLMALGRGWSHLRHISIGSSQQSEGGLIAFLTLAVRLQSFNSYSKWADAT